MRRGSSGSNVSSPPMTLGLLKSIATGYPCTEGASDASELRQKIIFKKARIRIDIIDGAAVDPNGSEQASELADARQVGADLAILEKDRTPTVSAFDSTIEVVPLVHPA